MRKVSPQNLEILVVDDSSSNRVFFERELNVRLFHNTYRTGAGASRHLGILNASNPYCLLVDSHMRFEAGWYEETVKALKTSPKSFWCASCLAFTASHPSYTMPPEGQYWGADFDFAKFDGVWAKERADGAELPCMMGACYLVPRRAYLQFGGGLQYLRGWGLEEMTLSLKAWLFGHDVRLMKNVRLWHRFRLPREGLPYTLYVWQVTYNRLFLIYTLLPDEVGGRIIHGFPKDQAFHLAMTEIKKDWNIIVSEREYNRLTMKRSFDWLLRKFYITIP